MNGAFDSPTARKNRGAFFTPVEIAAFMAAWAIRERDDSVLEPSCGDAVFLREAGRRFRQLGAPPEAAQLVGYDIHADSLHDARDLLRSEGMDAQLHHSDFFEVETDRRFTAVLGNPPFIRFQGFTGRSRDLAIAHAQRQGVELSGLASSWAGFVVRSAELLEPGGRLAFVLPSELLAVNYAATVRRFLMRSFASLEIVAFDHLVFSGVQTDAVVLLADGYRSGSTQTLVVRRASTPSDAATASRTEWRPEDAAGKWTDALSSSGRDDDIVRSFDSLTSPLASWGFVTSGVVTGANDFFCLSRSRADELGLNDSELSRILPRGLSLSALTTLTPARWRAESVHRDALLFSPGRELSAAAERYITAGELARLHDRYKTRIRVEWWRVPLNDPPDCFVSYMSAATPRIVANRSNARNLNSVHGLRFAPHVSVHARAALPIVALSSISLLSAESVGRSYGGGVLKMEPREADRWLVPSVPVTEELVSHHRGELSRAARHIRDGEPAAATAIVDRLLELAATRRGERAPETTAVAGARSERLGRRLTRAVGRNKKNEL